MGNPVLSVIKVDKLFGGLVALREMTFDVGEGEVLGLMGPNGAGKSTLLNVVSGVYKPEAGAVRFKGINVTGLPPHRICRLGIARTFQIPQPFVNLTTLQNLIVAAEYGRGIGRAEAEEEAKEILSIVDLYDKRDSITRDLAAITLKRLELARALASKPALILLDEVAAGLTEEEIPRMLEILQVIRDMGIACILIEHIMRVMTRAVDRIIVMDKGREIAKGTPGEVMENTRVIEAYLGAAPGAGERGSAEG